MRMRPILRGGLIRLDYLVAHAKLELKVKEALRAMLKKLLQSAKAAFLSRHNTSRMLLVQVSRGL
ncbi:hypothetical protein TU87_22870 [Pseudomonas weihenstephanensis]|nr:hypothetical protein TU87_22870 [Pseudomonas weihenstephanensis]